MCVTLEAWCAVMLRSRGRSSRLWRGGDSGCWPIRTSELLSDSLLLWRCRMKTGIRVYKELQCVYTTTITISHYKQQICGFMDYNGSDLVFCIMPLVCGPNLFRNNVFVVVCFKGHLYVYNIWLLKKQCLVTWLVLCLFGHQRADPRSTLVLINMYADLLNRSTFVVTKNQE